MNNQYGDLTLTTAQIQERLNLVPEHSQAIAALQQAITAFVTSEQVQTLIGTALADYSTTSDMNTAINNAIASALTSYYTKSQMDSKFADYSTTSQMNSAISSAISTALASYSTTSQMNTAIGNAIATALTSYYTKTEMDVIIQSIQSNLLFLNRALGKYNAVSERTLSQDIAGKYVNVNGQAVSASGYGISAEVSLNAGDILLVPSAQAVPADVSVVARKITNTYDKVITYTYTTDPETGRYLTATADYDPTLIYSAIYDGEGVFLYWVHNGVQYTQLPATRHVTESLYEPLVKQAVSAMPDTGYYVYLCPQGMTVVISGLTATVSGGVALIVGLGVFKNIATNFLGAIGQSIVAQAFAQTLGDIQGIIENLKHMGSFKATDIDCENMPKVCGYPLVVEGAGAPSIVPRFVGQRYHDTTNNKCYEAFSVTNSTANWVLLN